jgi:hypothetical protein
MADFPDPPAPDNDLHLDLASDVDPLGGIAGSGPGKHLPRDFLRLRGPQETKTEPRQGQAGHRKRRGRKSTSSVIPQNA